MIVSIAIVLYVALGVVSLGLLLQASNAYAGCTTPVVHRGRKYDHSYVCGRLQRFERYGHETQPPRDPRRACKPCRRNMRRGHIAAMWWTYTSLLIGVIFAFSVAQRIVAAETVHTGIALVAFVVTSAAPSLLAFFSTEALAADALKDGEGR